jgi:hypothetical protein
VLVHLEHRVDDPRRHDRARTGFDDPPERVRHGAALGEALQGPASTRAAGLPTGPALSIDTPLTAVRIVQTLSVSFATRYRVWG